MIEFYQIKIRFKLFKFNFSFYMVQIYTIYIYIQKILKKKIITYINKL